MADIKLSTIAGGAGGSFITRFASGHLVIAIGASGTIITLTPPSGERVKLMGLATSAGTETGVTVNIDASAVVTSLGLVTTTTATGQFNIGQSAVGAGSFDHFLGGINEVITVVKDTSTTSQTINYSYEFGV